MAEVVSAPLHNLFGARPEKMNKSRSVNIFGAVCAVCPSHPWPPSLWRCGQRSACQSASRCHDWVLHPSLLRASIVLGDLVTLTVVLVVGFLLLMYFSAHSAWQRTSWLPLKTEATFHCHDWFSLVISELVARCRTCVRLCVCVLHYYYLQHLRSTSLLHFWTNKMVHFIWSQSFHGE